MHGLDILTGLLDKGALEELLPLSKAESPRHETAHAATSNAALGAQAWQSPGCMGNVRKGGR